VGVGEAFVGFKDGPEEIPDAAEVSVELKEALEVELPVVTDVDPDVSEVAMPVVKAVGNTAMGVAATAFRVQTMNVAVTSSMFAFTSHDGEVKAAFNIAVGVPEVTLPANVNVINAGKPPAGFVIVPVIVGG